MKPCWTTCEPVQVVHFFHSTALRAATTDCATTSTEATTSPTCTSATARASRPHRAGRGRRAGRRRRRLRTAGPRAASQSPRGEGKSKPANSCQHDEKTPQSCQLNQSHRSIPSKSHSSDASELFLHIPKMNRNTYGKSPREKQKYPRSHSRFAEADALIAAFPAIVDRCHHFRLSTWPSSGLSTRRCTSAPQNINILKCFWVLSDVYTPQTSNPSHLPLWKKRYLHGPSEVDLLTVQEKYVFPAKTNEHQELMIRHLEIVCTTH